MSKLSEMLAKHEGKRNKPYRDTKGYLTVGIGRNIDTVPFGEDEIQLMFENDIKSRRKGLAARLDWFDNLDSTRQDVLIDMSFMGLDSLMKFVKMLNCLHLGNYDKAADELLDSQYAKEVGSRAKELAQMLRTGVYDDKEFK
jgi:lysozyme